MESLQKAVEQPGRQISKFKSFTGSEDVLDARIAKATFASFLDSLEVEGFPDASVPFGREGTERRGLRLRLPGEASALPRYRFVIRTTDNTMSADKGFLRMALVSPEQRKIAGYCSEKVGASGERIVDLNDREDHQIGSVLTLDPTVTFVDG